MKAIIIYSSIHHGNTEKVGRKMAKVLNANIMDVKDVDIHDLDDYDVIGFGSGIYYGKFHRNMMNLIDGLPNLSDKKAFVFSTSGQGKEKYNNSIEERLKEKGFDVLGSFTCKGYDTFGPLKLVGGIGKDRPNDDDLNKAKEFAEKIYRM